MPSDRQRMIEMAKHQIDVCVLHSEICIKYVMFFYGIMEYKLYGLCFSFYLIRVGRVNNYGFIWELQKERDRKISGMKSNERLIHAKGHLAP